MKRTIGAMIVAAVLASAQPPAQAPAKPDSEAVKALIEKAKKAGGARWAHPPSNCQPDDRPALVAGLPLICK